MYLAQYVWGEEDDGDQVAEDGSSAQSRVVQQLTCCKATQPLERLNHHLTEAIHGPADEVGHCCDCQENREEVPGHLPTSKNPGAMREGTWLGLGGKGTLGTTGTTN